jgi:SAM-dependent methyltransferase
VSATQYTTRLVETEKSTWDWHRCMYNDLCRGGNMLDVGTGSGRSFMYMYDMASANSTVYGVDSYNNSSSDDVQSVINFIANNCTQIDADKTDTIDIRQKDVLVADSLDYIPHGSVSFMHVDAAALHNTYVEVVSNLLPLLKPSGILVTPFHGIVNGMVLNVTRLTSILEHQQRGNLYPFAFTNHAVYSTNDFNKAVEYKKALMDIARTNNTNTFNVPFGSGYVIQLVPTTSGAYNETPTDTNRVSVSDLINDASYVENFITSTIETIRDQ